MNKKIIFGIVTLISACLTQTTSATVIGLNDFSGTETVETFGQSFQVGTPLLLNGVTYSSATTSMIVRTNRSSFFNNIPEASLGGSLEDNAGQSNIAITFSETVNRFGMFLSAGGTSNWLLSAFDDNLQLLGSSLFTGGSGGNAIFAGFEFNQNISSLTITEQSNNNSFVTMIDDLRYEALPVPEPSASVLMTLGLAGLALSRRKEKGRA